MHFPLHHLGCPGSRRTEHDEAVPSDGTAPASAGPLLPPGGVAPQRGPLPSRRVAFPDRLGAVRAPARPNPDAELRDVPVARTCTLRSMSPPPPRPSGGPGPPAVPHPDQRRRESGEGRRGSRPPSLARPEGPPASPRSQRKVRDESLPRPASALHLALTGPRRAWGPGWGGAVAPAAPSGRSIPR